MTEDLRVDAISVDVQIAHPYAGDLTVTLEKDGIVATLQDRQGGSADDIRRTFAVTAMNASNARGTWRLHVVDTARADVGTLERWRLLLTAHAP